MRRLIDLTNGENRVFIHLTNGKAMSDFLKQAEAEGFVINGKLPTQAACEQVMILHSDYTISYLYGWVISTVFGHTKAKHVDYAKYKNEDTNYYCGINNCNRKQ